MRLPLKHHNALVGYAIVDDSMSYLASLAWGLDVPPTIRRIGSPDVVVATLIEDPLALPRCRPFFQGRGLVIRLNRFVIRPEVYSLVSSYLITKKETTRHDLTSTLATIGRLIHVNGSRIDCRVDNLREITTGINDPTEGVSHA